MQKEKTVPDFEEVKHELTPLIDFDNYLVHCPSGNVWSKITNKWLLVNAKGTGDNNKYLQTGLKGNDGKTHFMYLSDIVMSSYMGMRKSDWRALGLECDHIDNNDTKNNSISNLRLVTSAANKRNCKDRFWNKVRLSMDVANNLRKEFEKCTGSKVEWYKQKGKELGVTARSIQNIILGYTYVDCE